MVTSSQQTCEDSYSELHPTGHTSNVLQLFAEGLERVKESQVLDVGPVCGDNISFLAQRVRRLYICDMFFHLERDRREGLPPTQVWRYLDYPPQSFDGILLWNLVDHLGDQQVARLVEVCHDMVRPGGIVLVFLMGEQVVGSVVYSFVIKDRFQLHIRPQPHLHLPQHVRKNREVLANLAPFTLVKAFLYHNGVREFFFQRD